MSSFFLTVVTVVLNDIDRLRETLESIQSQTSRDFEWLVIDGGSTDGSRELVMEKSVTFGEAGMAVRTIFEPDRGLYDAMNKGISAALGQYVTFLNAGDVLAEHGAIETSIANVQKTGCPPIVFFDALAVYPGDLLVRLPAKPFWPAVKHSSPASHQATWFDKTLHAEIPYDPSFRVSADYCAIATFAAAGVRSASIGSTFVIVDKGTESVSFRYPIKHMIECARVQRRVLRLGLLYVTLSGFNRAAKKLFWVFSASPISRWLLPPLLVIRSRFAQRQGQL